MHIKFDFIILHETAHEWWGNSITTNDIADMWVHESFAAYSEALYVEHQFGYEEAMKYVNSKKLWLKPPFSPCNVRHFVISLPFLFQPGFNDPKKKSKKNTPQIPTFVKDSVDEISDFFGQKITIKMGKKDNGSISIPFHSKEDYKRILKLLKSD